MFQPLPYGDFKEVKNCENFNYENISDDSEYGFILEIDVSFSQELHNSQKDLPMMPEKPIPSDLKHVKLLATLWDKNEYVIYYRNLKQAKFHGMKINKIHRI